MTIREITVYRYSIPMVPFTIATGTMNYAQNVLIHIKTSKGITGVGECSAFPMIVGETQDTCFVLAKDFAGIWKGKDATRIEDRLKELDDYITHNHTIKSAFDMALYDIAAKAKEMPLWEYLGGHYFEPESDLTIGIGPVQDMADTARDFVHNRKVTMLKVKVGKGVAEDVERITSVRLAAGPNVKIRIDANCGWDFEQAVEALTAMQSLDIQFCEQPMPKFRDHKMASLKRISSIPIMADESVFSHHDAKRLIYNKSCDYINIKLCKAGGITEALRIHDRCEANDMPNMLGGMLESRVALSANVHMALACPNIQFYDLDTCLLGHKIDPVIGGVQFDGMKLKLPNLPGIGADADPEYLKGCEQFTV
ncbi:MAG: dipeptide epimerase [Chitinophagaceae bacterium]